MYGKRFHPDQEIRATRRPFERLFRSVPRLGRVNPHSFQPMLTINHDEFDLRVNEFLLNQIRRCATLFLCTAHQPFFLPRDLFKVHRMIWIRQIVGLGVVLIMLNLFGVFGFRYFQPVENDPLVHPANVVNLTRERMTLDDSRVIRVESGMDFDTQRQIEQSGLRVDVEILSGQSAMVYYKQQRLICGLGMPIFTIPLIPMRVKKYERRLAFIGEIETQTEAPANTSAL